MPADWRLDFADETGRCFARHYGMPPMTGRTLGWLLVCDPAQQTIAEVADNLQASRSGVTTAIHQLEASSWVLRTRAAGERVDRVRLHPGAWTQLLNNQSEYRALQALARSGMAAGLGGDCVRLAELAAFADFLAEKMPTLVEEWQNRLDAVHADHRP